MKALAKILGGGLALFIVLAIAQEWELFSAAWFGSEESVPEVTHGERQKATNTLRLALDLTAHLYSSGGDRRFAERIPAGPGILDEVMADIDYLARNHRMQGQELETFEVVSVVPLEAERLEIRTRERWRVDLGWLDGRQDDEPARLELVKGRYLLERSGSGWRVVGWAFDDQPSTPIEARP